MCNLKTSFHVLFFFARPLISTSFKSFCFASTVIYMDFLIPAFTGSIFTFSNTDLTCLARPPLLPFLLYTLRMNFRTNLILARLFTCLQTDDTSNIGNRLFMPNKATAAKLFDCKPAWILSTAGPIIFNTATISKRGSNRRLSHSSHNRKLSSVSQIPAKKHSFIASHARKAYIAAVFCPDHSFGFSVCSHHVSPGFEAVGPPINFTHQDIFTVDIALCYVPLYYKTGKLAVSTDSTSANNPDLSAQLGYIPVLYDGCKNAKRFHFPCTRCILVTRSVLASNFIAAVYGYDYSSMVQLTFNDIPEHQVPLMLCTDSKCSSDGLVNIGTMKKKRFLISPLIIPKA